MLTAVAEDFERPLCPSAHRRRCHNVTTRGVKASHAASYLGEKRQLVILVSFRNKSFKDAQPLILWDRIFNEEFFREAPFYGSVHDYFYDQSYGKFSLQFDLYLVEAKNNSNYYGGQDAYGNDEKVGELVKESVLNIADQIPDWSIYDWDDDGEVDQVLLLYAGKGQNDGGLSSTIWPHQWTLEEEGTGKFRVGSDMLVRYINGYGCFAELDSKGTYGSFGTLCHEYSHCLGLPDFYYGGTKYVGSWDVMDYGLYNKNGFCPAGYSAHERMVLGWLAPSELTAPISISEVYDLTDYSKAKAFLIRNDGYEDEYYIVENRQKTGWDQALPGHGVVVFHVDYDEYVWKHDIPNTPTKKRYTIIPANNTTSVSSSANWSYPYKTNDMLTNLSKPAATLYNRNSDGSNLMSKPVTQIKVTNGVASFDFMGGSPTSLAATQALEDSYKVLYRIGSVLIIRDGKGFIRKVISHSGK